MIEELVIVFLYGAVVGAGFFMGFAVMACIYFGIDWIWMKYIKKEGKV